MTTRLRSWLRAPALALVLALSTAPVAACGGNSELDVVHVPEDAATLADAHDRVAPGGMILIGEGVYAEQVVVTKPDVTVRGVDRNAVVIDGEGTRPYGIVVVADGVRVENLTVRGTTFYGVLVTGLYGEDGPSAHTANGYEPFDPEAFPPVERFAVRFVTAHNNGLYGIYAFNARHGVISDSYASGSADSGFYVGQCRECDVLVTGNVAERNAVGFENANASDSLTIVGNRFANNRVGLTLISNYQEAFTPQRANLVVGNVLSDNVGADSPSQESGGFGIGVGLSGAVDNIVERNRIEGNARAGILLDSTEDLASTGNAFADNIMAGNGVDLANVSAARASASANCAYPSADLTTLPTGLLSACPDSAAPQPAVEVSDLPSPDAPPGMSFLEVPAPGPQPTMPDPAAPPTDSLPATVDHPDVTDIAAPPADLLAEVTGP